ncbi:hypothetical protein MBLNU459_g4716t1 [Dothideomycetes sp. NU459]
MAESSSPVPLEPKSLARPSAPSAPVSGSVEHGTPTRADNRLPSGASRQRGYWSDAHRGAVAAGPSQSHKPQTTSDRPNLNDVVHGNKNSNAENGPEQRSNMSEDGLAKTATRRSHRSMSDQEQHNLTELTAPAPVQDRDQGTREKSKAVPDTSGAGITRRATRGTHRSMSEEADENLTELTAPEPVQDADQTPGGWQRQSFLEEADDDDDSQESAEPPPAFGRKPASHTAPAPSRSEKVSKLATDLYTVSYLIFFSIFGTLARLGVQWLTFYPGSPIVTPVLWANFGGSFVLGFLSEDRRMFREEWGPRKQRSHDEEKADEEAMKKRHATVKKTIPLYIGLATGFCGSFTSFSSFQRDAFLALSNNLPTPDNHPHAGAAAPSFSSTVHRNGGYSFMALIAIIVYTIVLSMGALKVGAHFALLLDPYTPTLPFSFTRKIVDKAMVFVAFGCWLGAIFLCIWPPDRPDGPSSRGRWTNEVWRGEVLFALVFAPVGCLLRFYASLKLNALVMSFPLGTFAVNIFGCAIEAMCYDIQHVPILSTSSSLAGGGRVGCQVLQGVMDGFCGCLTTVSTWVSELQGLRRRHSYVYGLASVGIGLSVMVLIMGSVRWSIGWSETACVTMRTSN